MPNSSSIEVPKVSSGNPQAQRRSQVAGTFDRLDANGSTSNNQKKRKSCLEGEDQEPIAPVRKAELKGERNTTQRAQVIILLTLIVYKFSPTLLLVVVMLFL